MDGAILITFLIAGAFGLFVGFGVGRMCPFEDDLKIEYYKGRDDQLHNKKDRWN
jgi:hypothetical protein